MRAVTRLFPLVAALSLTGCAGVGAPGTGFAEQQRLIAACASEMGLQAGSARVRRSLALGGTTLEVLPGQGIGVDVAARLNTCKDARVAAMQAADGAAVPVAAPVQSAPVRPAVVVPGTCGNQSVLVGGAGYCAQ